MRLRIGLAAAAALTVAAVPASAQDDGAVRYDDHRLLRVDLTAPGQIGMLESLGSRILDCVHGAGPMRCVVPPHVLFDLDVAGIRYEVLHENVQDLIDAESERLAGNIGGIAGLGACDLGWFDDYHALADIDARMDLIVAEHPDVVEKFQFGTTIEGRPLWAMRITAPGGGDKPAVLYNGCQHAREWVAPTVPMYIATRLACGWASGDAEITSILEAVEFIVVPMVNPDGYDYSWPPGDRFWRKNRRNNGDGTFGVDINRNWGVGWSGPGASPNSNSETYYGTAPFSEPETAAMRDLFEANPHILATIDFHSYSQLVLWPWGSFFEAPDDAGLYVELGSEMEAAIETVNGFGYVQGQAAPTLYQASGISIDWTYGERGAFSFTVELRDQGQNGFELPPDQILPTCEENFAGAMTLAEWITLGVSVTYPGGLPSLVAADQPATFSAQITPITVDGVTEARLLTRVGAGPEFSTAAMTDLGDGVYEGTLPAAPCGATIEFYIEVEADSGVVYLEPAGAPGEFYSAQAFDIDTSFEDDFESDLGWTVANSGLTDGAWDRGVPVGGGDRGDPPSDADGSGQCYLTDNVDGNSDVDGGSTVLTSPLLDGTADDAEVQYYRWYSNDQGNAPNQDTMLVEISGDGGQTWTLLEEVSENANAWVLRSFRIADFVAPSAEVQVRFDARDLGEGSVVEAGVDGVRVVTVGCGGEPGVPGDVNGDGLVDVQDLVEIITNWGPCPGCPADLTGDGVVDVQDLVEAITNWS